MGERHEKPWGWSELLASASDSLLTRIEVRRGGFCSRHLHARQHNTFVIVSGTLRVCLLLSRSSGGMAEYCLRPDGLRCITIEAGMVHWFVAEQDVVALELYTPDGASPPDQQDIERFSEGGVVGG